MSRHGYNDYYCDDIWATIRWSGAVKSAIRGRRGQALLRRMAKALDAMPEKRLIAEDIVREDGACCALGAVAKAEGIDVQDLCPDDAQRVAKTFGIAESLAREIVWQNDDTVRPLAMVAEGGYYEAPDGSRIPTYSARFYKGDPSELKLVPLTYRSPSPEEREKNERLRWQVMRKWVDKHLMDREEADERAAQDV